ncbi:hypothetical protein ACFV00_33855, partial [Streptomyces californicus]
LWAGGGGAAWAPAGGGGGGGGGAAPPPPRAGEDRRTPAAVREGRLALLVLAALAALLAADLSGMSKAETERIWQPFLLWLLPAAALLPRRGVRWWLAASASPALLVHHLLWTGW